MRWRCLIFVALVASSPVFAHDFWIEPSAFTPTAGELVTLKLLVGQHLSGETLPRNEEQIESFYSRQRGVESPVIGMDGSEPAGILRANGDGGVVIAYRSNRSAVVMDPAKFQEYLDLEGLPKVAPGREVFSRCAKCLLAVSGRGDPSFTKPVGMTLELTPESDPYALTPGGKLTVRLLYRDKPLPNALVMALDQVDANNPQRVRTDANGRATFTLPRAGAWLIKAVHMIPAPRDASADWESFWASLTFAVPPATP